MTGWSAGQISPELSELTRARTSRAWLMLSPAIIILLVMAAWPLGRTLWFSLHYVYLDGLDQAEWAGLEQFFALFTDAHWWQSVWNTLIFAGVSVTLEAVLGLAIAALLDRHFRMNGILRALVLIP